MPTPFPILVVEDDDAIREFVCDVLIDEGYAALTAPNGVDALDVVHHTPPALILLDLRMPGMDGWEFLDHYHRLPAPHAPVIVCTTASDADLRAAPVHASSVITKPFDLDYLLRLIKQHVSIK
jgi:two-component system, response regulator, stage 0 sporulation protein F